MDPSRIRNVAIIAHVDHGKTTLVDALLRQSGTFRANEQVPERVMDSMDLERERGITIQAKNCSFEWEGLTVNIVDTPGHADFGGEVERILSMVDGALLLVDAAEGPLPQTRFVLSKALAAGLELVVVVNKIDRKDARVFEVRNEIFSLFIDCGADDRHLECPVIYAVARDGAATRDLGGTPTDMRPVFEAIRDHIPPPRVEPGAASGAFDGAPAPSALSMIVANLGWSDYVGRLAIGRIRSGTLRAGDEVLCVGAAGSVRGRVVKVFGYRGLKTVERDEAGPGEIVSVAGLDDVEIGDTLTSIEAPRVLPRIRVEAPTVEMRFGPNTSPFAGREGRYVTARQVGDRLLREARRNVALRIRPLEEGEGRFAVAGRGELQLGILIETMRREGYEVEVSRPTAIEREEGGARLEPYEKLVVDCDEAHLGAATELFAGRRGVLERLDGVGTGRVRLEFRIPSRGLFGTRSRFLTATRGTGLLHAVFDSYGPLAGPIGGRTTGAMISDRACEATSYAIRILEPRGRLFVAPGTPCYGGMVVGETSKAEDMEVYIGRPKKMTNVRSSTAEQTVTLTPPVVHTLESAMEWIGDDELVEATPGSIRIRKRLLDPSARKAARKAAAEGGA